MLSGEHGFVESLWLPSGAAIARTHRELWLMTPSEPDHARRLHFDAAIQSMTLARTDDVVALAMEDGAVHLVRDLRIVHTLPGPGDAPLTHLELSPDGTLLARSFIRSGEGAQTDLFDVATGQVTATIPDAASLSFDSTSHFVSDDLAVYDRAGKRLWKSGELQRFFRNEWVGTRVAYWDAKVLRLIDPSTGRSKDLDIACKGAEEAQIDLVDRGRFVRACGNRFMLVDAATATLHRIKLPLAAHTPLNQIGMRPDGYVLTTYEPGEELFVDANAYVARTAKTPSWTEADALAPELQHGEYYLDLDASSVAVRRIDSDALVSGWGGSLNVLAEQRSVVHFGFSHRLRDGVLEVVARGRSSEKSPPVVHRFGPPAQAQKPPSAPPECGAGVFVKGMVLDSHVDVRRVAGRSDAVCICLPEGCSVRPYQQSWQLLAATTEDTLYVEAGSTETHVLRVGKDGTQEARVEGHCASGAIARDRRVFLLCLDFGFKKKSKAGIGASLTELSSSLAKVGARTLPNGPPSEALEVVGDELAVSRIGNGVTVTHFFPVGSPGCTSCTIPTAKLSTWSTFSVLERDGKVQVAGKLADAERAVVCLDGEHVGPWSACRP